MQINIQTPEEFGKNVGLHLDHVIQLCEAGMPHLRPLGEEGPYVIEANSAGTWLFQNSQMRQGDWTHIEKLEGKGADIVPVRNLPPGGPVRN